MKRLYPFKTSVMSDNFSMQRTSISSSYGQFNARKLLILFACIILFSQATTSLFAQESSEKAKIDLTPLESGSISAQLDFIIEKSNKYEDTRVIKGFWLTRLRAHVVDTLRTVNRKLNESQKIISKKQVEIDSLKASVSNINAGLATVTNEKDSIKLFGVLINKNLYQTIMWLVIIGLTLLLIILGFLFKRSNSVTIQTKTDLEELKEEFENHRKRALEREAQLSRKHLDEIIKLKK